MPGVKIMGIKINNTPDKYLDFYIETMNNDKFSTFFQKALSLKTNLEKEAGIKKEQDMNKSTIELDKLELTINKKLGKLSFNGIKSNVVYAWFIREKVQLSQIYATTFNGVYLTEEILEEFRKHIEASKNTNIPIQIVSTIEKQYNEYLKNKPSINKGLKKSDSRPDFLKDILLYIFCTMGVNNKALELKYMKTNRMSEANAILKKNEEVIESTINFINSLTYEQMELIVEIYDLVIEHKNLVDVFQKDKEKIEKEYEDYISNIWNKTYEELERKHPNNIALEKILIIEYYKIYFLKKIGKYERKEKFNEEEISMPFYEAIENFFKINSEAIDEIETEVTDCIYNYFETKTEKNKTLKKQI